MSRAQVNSSEGQGQVTSSEEQGQGRSRQEIEAWLQRRIATFVGCYPHEVDVDTRFSEFGLDSVAALDLLGELEDWLGRQVPQRLLARHDRVAALAAHLAEP